MANDDPFHAGERELQTLYGTRERLACDGARLIRSTLSEQHREFFSALNYIVAAFPDTRQHPTPAVLTGKPGFINCPTESRISFCGEFDGLPGPVPRVGDPVALLGIDFATRRRNRVNGVIDNVDRDSLDISVLQAFGNCAKYIRQRALRPLSIFEPRQAPRAGSELTDVCIRAIASADTAFLATSNGYAHPIALDISHRGGPPGFLQRTGLASLQFQDFKGNGFFNSLGNLALNPDASLLIANFEQGQFLTLRGQCRLIDDATTNDFEFATTRAYEFVWEKWSLYQSPLITTVI